MLEHNPKLKELWEAAPKENVSEHVIRLVPSGETDDFIKEFARVLECPHFITKERQKNCKICKTP